MSDPFAPLPAFTGRPPKARRRHVIAPTGPRIFRLGTKPTRLGVGPGEMPPEFKTAHTSLDEWYVYWGLAKVTGTPKDPRRPPFTGGDWWTFQKAESPTGIGLARGRVAGGSVSDFVVLNPTERTLVIRVQTERFHIFAHAQQQARDLFIRDQLRGVEKVIDIYSSDFLGDPTGEAVCRVVALALKGIELPSPIRFRTALRIRAVRP